MGIREQLAFVDDEVYVGVGVYLLACVWMANTAGNTVASIGEQSVIDIGSAPFVVMVITFGLMLTIGTVLCLSGFLVLREVADDS